MYSKFHSSEVILLWPSERNQTLKDRHASQEFRTRGREEDIHGEEMPSGGVRVRISQRPPAHLSLGSITFREVKGSSAPLFPFIYIP
jgi:hypothetical protein